MFLKKMDMLSPKITLYYKRNNTHSSKISGVLTIFAYLSVICFGIIYFLRYINREDPTAYSFYRFVKDVGDFPFYNLNFFNYIQINKMGSRVINEFDSSKIEIIGINMSLDSFINSGNETNYPFWIYDKCDNETNIKGIEDLINNETFNRSSCIKYFYNNINNEFYDINNDNFEWPIIKHGASHSNFTYFGAMIRRCQNTSFRLKYFNECSPDKEINEYLNQTFLTFSVMDHYVDVLNFKNPISKFLHTVTNKLEIDSYIINNLNFNPGLIITHDIYFNNKVVEQSTYFFHENSQTTSPTRDTGILAVFYFWLQNSQQYYERRYKKLQDVLSEIGGFGSGIIIIAKLLNYLFFDLLCYLTPKNSYHYFF